MTFLKPPAATATSADQATDETKLIDATGALRVPQRTYAVTKRGRGPAALITRTIWSCMGYVGVNPNTGVVFCAHFDTGFAVLGLPRMLRDIREANGGSLDGFDIYDVAGMPPWAPAVSTAVGVAAYLAHWNSVIILSLLIFGVLFLHARVMLWLGLKLLGVNQFDSLKCCKLGLLDSGATSSVRIDTDGGVFIDTGCSVEDKLFREPKWYYPWLSKAPGSL